MTLRQSPRSGEGQATVEVALVLPLVGALLLVLAQLGLIVRDQILVVHAAREAARAAAVEPTLRSARKAALAGAPLAANRLALQLTGRSSGPVKAILSYRSPTYLPMVGHLIPDIVVSAQASMRREHG